MEMQSEEEDKGESLSVVVASDDDWLTWASLVAAGVCAEGGV